MRKTKTQEKQKVNDYLGSSFPEQVKIFFTYD